ncbi:MAG: DUF309 domain-containing protein [Candidatus Nitrosocaldus sp.]
MLTRYMIRLVNNGYKPEDSASILSKARGISADVGSYTVEIRDARVARRHVELDVSVAPSMLDILLKELEGIAPVLSYTEVTERRMDMDERIAYARELFNAERYWEAHEVLEGAWKSSKGDEKGLIQGIILVCAALVHAQKAEYDICLSILGRALQKLQDKEQYYSYHGIDIAMLVRQITIALDSSDVKTMLEYRL